MGSEPLFDLEFPKWEQSEAVSRSVLGVTHVVAALEVLLGVTVVVLAAGFIRSLWPRRHVFSSVTVTEVEGAEEQLGVAHSLYREVLDALRAYRFDSNLRGLVADADMRTSAQVDRIERALPRLSQADAAALRRMQASVARVREAVARLATRYGERAFGFSETLGEVLAHLSSARPADAGHGTGARALGAACMLLACLDLGSTVTPAFTNVWVVILAGVPYLACSLAFVLSARARPGVVRWLLTGVSLTGLLALLWLATFVCWWPTLLPASCVFVWWACVRVTRRGLIAPS